MNSYILSLLASCIICLNISCGDDNKKTKKNDSPKEDKNENAFTLPPELKEISGISFIDNDTFLAVQDEEGVVYTYDLTQQKIIAAKQFAGTGDFEDVAVAEKDAYAVRSDGVIYHIKNYGSEKPDVESYQTYLTAENNIEGIAYDKENNRLLLASKDEGVDNDKNKEIFAFDLKTKKLDPHPVFAIDIAKIENYYKGDALEETSKKFLKALGNTNMNEVFRPSALTVHPSTGEIFVLSSINNMVGIFDNTGNLKRMFTLKGKEFTQPEGIAFSTGGQLYISNEGRGKKGNVTRITY